VPHSCSNWITLVLSPLKRNGRELAIPLF